MKKIIIGTVLGFSLAMFPLATYAQTTDAPATSAQVDEMKATLIALLMQMIAQLQAQINQMLAQQATQQTQINTVVQNTTPSQPVLGAVEIPAPPSPPSITGKLGTPVCVAGNIEIPFIGSGKWTRAKITATPLIHPVEHNNSVFSSLHNQTETTFSIPANDYTVVLDVLDDSINYNPNVFDPRIVVNTEEIITNPCI